MAKYYITEAIVLKNQDFIETDKIVTFFARREGKLRAVAKGIKKPNSSLRGAVQPFCFSCLHLSRGRELDLITQGRIIEFFGYVRDDMVKTLHSLYLMELLDKSLAEADPHPEVFDATLTVLRCLEDGPFSPLAVRWFELKLARELGYALGLQKCILCGRGKAVVLSIKDGGVLCDRCNRASTDNLIFALDGELWALLRDLEQKDVSFLQRVKPSARALRVAEQILERYLEYHLGHRFNTKSVIRNLLEDK
ncbi:MAG: DNA repair protein RecO [Syntrophothermus sp.]|uniref:DNA repair protein RecO n=1 Tax=Syntrophothermus sp. TaxID=2736299 RepID=UPI00257B2A01|nr:DNA repair protein RecO [Syntrophothermus sp.]NSW83552.1 DNA repair protein RecO [Syntrophothermus sp.]